MERQSTSKNRDAKEAILACKKWQLRPCQIQIPYEQRPLGKLRLSRRSCFKASHPREILEAARKRSEFKKAYEI